MPLRRSPDPFRVLAFAIDVGDAPLVALLVARLFPANPPGSRAARRAVARLARLLEIAD